MGHPAFCPAQLAGGLLVMHQITSHVLLSHCISRNHQEYRICFWVLASPRNSDICRSIWVSLNISTLLTLQVHYLSCRLSRLWSGPSFKQDYSTSGWLSVSHDASRWSPKLEIHKVVIWRHSQLHSLWEQLSNLLTQSREAKGQPMKPSHCIIPNHGRAPLLEFYYHTRTHNRDDSRAARRHRRHTKPLVFELGSICNLDFNFSVSNGFSGHHVCICFDYLTCFGVISLRYSDICS